MQADLVPVGILKDAARPRKPFPRLTMALRAIPRRDHNVFGFKTAGAALQLKDGDTGRGALEWIVRGEMAFRREAFHAN